MFVSNYVTKVFVMEKAQDEQIAVELPSPPEELKTEQSKLGTGDDDNTDPYAYLNRNEFSSENFKIEIKNLPKYFGVGVIYIQLLLKCFYHNNICIFFLAIEEVPEKTRTQCS
jgi:hypothetical protein